MKKYSLLFSTLSLLMVFFSACHKTHYQNSAVNTSTNISDSIEQSEATVVVDSFGNFYYKGVYYAAPVNPMDWYSKAYDELDVLINQTATQSKGNFKKAVFTVENAWYENSLNYNEFNNYIGRMAAICPVWVESNKLDYHAKDSIQINLSAAVFTLITDTITSKKGLTITMPYRYDFNDYFGEKNWENMFVNKLLASNSGNCHSLPFLYKILCEELNVPAYLSLAPNHIFIRQYSKKVGWYNTELTSGQFPIDAWVMAAGYVSTESIVSGIYMDTLSYEQSIALCVNDLAKGYLKKFGKAADLSFVLKCCELGLKHYPNYAELLLLKAETLRSIYEKTESKESYAKMSAVYDTLYQLHYREIPDEMFEEWTSTLNRDTNVYQRNTAPKAEKRKTNSILAQRPEALTLSNGRYDEFFFSDTLQRIGSVMYNIYLQKIEYLLDRNDSSIYRPSETGRWMSVDPVFQPWQSPYTSMDNNPINLNDPLGDLPPSKKLKNGEKFTADFGKGSETYILKEITDEKEKQTIKKDHEYELENTSHGSVYYHKNKDKKRLDKYVSQTINGVTYYYKLVSPDKIKDEFETVKKEVITQKEPEKKEEAPPKEPEEKLTPKWRDKEVKKGASWEIKENWYAGDREDPVAAGSKRNPDYTSTGVRVGAGQLAVAKGTWDDNRKDILNLINALNEAKDIKSITISMFPPITATLKEANFIRTVTTQNAYKNLAKYMRDNGLRRDIKIIKGAADVGGSDGSYFQIKVQ